MLNTLINELIGKLKEMQTEGGKLFKQVEPYEGQYDNISEYTLVPPSAFVELSDADPNPNGRQNTIKTTVAIYVSTNHIKGKKPTAMFNIIDEMRKSLNKRTFAKGFLFFNGFRRLAIFPGFITYQVNFIHDES